jgi:hypothetical protein
MPAASVKENVLHRERGAIHRAPTWSRIAPMSITRNARETAHDVDGHPRFSAGT